MTPEFPVYTDDQRRMWLNLTEQCSRYGTIGHDGMITYVKPQEGNYWWTRDPEIRELIKYNSFQFSWIDDDLSRVHAFLKAMRTVAGIEEEVDSEY